MTHRRKLRFDGVFTPDLGRGPDPVAEALARAPLDDEPLSVEDVAALAAADRDIAAGRFLTHAEVKRRMLRRSSRRT